MAAVSVAKKIVIVLLHLGALGIIFLALQPIASWYLTRIPALGVDLYYSATYVAYHLKHFSLPFNSFKDLWFGGYPLFRDIFQLHFYLMAPFAKTFGLIEGIRTYVVVSLFGLAVFSYFLFYQLGRNVVLAVLLAVLVLYSVNIYGAATWGGSLPYFATQLFFPLVLALLVKYRASGNRRWFYGAALFSGIGALGHPLPVVSFVFPAAFFILLFWNLKEFGRQFLKNILDIFLFFSVTVLISLRLFYPFLFNLVDAIVHGQIFGGVSSLARGTGLSQAQQSEEIASFYQGLALRLFTDTEQWLFYFLGVGGVVFVFSLVLFRDRLKRVGRVLPFVLTAGYIAGQVTANAYGFGFLAQGWYRAFWAFPIAIAALAAVLWGEFFRGFTRTFLRFGKALSKTILFFLIGIFSLTFALLGYYFYTQEPQSVIKIIEARSELSSAFPEALSIQVSSDDQEELKQKLTPSFMNPNDKNTRLYTVDAAVNIWWNALFEMPLARGYIDPPIAASERWGLFWLDLAIANDSLVREFDVDPDTAFANTLFLIDWNGIGYFEGGRISSKGPSPPPSSYLLENDVFSKEEEVTVYGAVLKYLTASGEPELHMEIPQSLKFYKVADEFTTPILYPTNAPAVAFFGDRASYEDLLRILGSRNLNSRKVIPVYGGEFIDGVDSRELTAFDAVIASQYRYRNQKRAFEVLKNYVNSGGNLFIDTGGEVKEAESLQLPEVFPVTTSQRRGFGRSWDFSVDAHPVTRDVDFSKFGPPIFDEDEWKLSVPIDAGDLREGSVVILQHSDKPLLVERALGKGQVIWSGMSLLFHYDQYTGDDEAQLFINILNQFISLEANEVLSATVEWEKPERVVIRTQEEVRGVLFKEEGYEGWRVKLTSHSNKRLPIYLTGPTFPGFMYVPIPETVDGPFTLQFSYHGETLYWVVTLVSFLVTVLVLEMILFDGRFIGKRFVPLARNAVKKVGSWWEKEEEY